jgi:hypothetical protein
MGIPSLSTGRNENSAKAYAVAEIIETNKAIAVLEGAEMRWLFKNNRLVILQQRVMLAAFCLN